MIRNNVLSFIAFSLIFVMMAGGCKKDDDNEIPYTGPDNRVFIINEGPFQTGSGSLSVFYRNTSQVYNDIFAGVNGFKLGNLVQSLSVHENKVYIVVNNAGRIEIAGKDDLVSLGSIEDINLPRYFLGISADKAYVSSWDNKVYVIDLNTNAVVSEIPTATGPEKMMMVGEEVWVLNQGGFSYDSTITIISSVNDAVIETLVVGHKPSGIAADKDNNIWVMCSGNGWNGFAGAGDSEGKLVCIDPLTHTIINTLPFLSTENHPEKLVIDNAGETLFYNYPGGLFSQNIYEETLQMDTIYESSTMFYALGYDPYSELIFVSDPLDYVQDGIVYRIDPLTKEMVGSFEAGIIPGEFFFN